MSGDQNQANTRSANAAQGATPWNFSSMSKSDRNKTGLKDDNQGAMGAEGAQTAHSLFDSKGAIGKQFQPDGALGSVGQAVGGPLGADGAIGKQFTDQGAVGGTVQSALGDQRKE